MSDPATKEDLEKVATTVLARLDVIREKSSQEHGAIIVRIDDQNTATRAHIGSEVATVRGDVGHMKNYMERLLKAFKRFLTRHGMGSDEL